MNGTIRPQGIRLAAHWFEVSLRTVAPNSSNLLRAIYKVRRKEFHLRPYCWHALIQSLLIGTCRTNQAFKTTSRVVMIDSTGPLPIKLIAMISATRLLIVRLSICVGRAMPATYCQNNFSCGIERSEIWVFIRPRNFHNIAVLRQLSSVTENSQ